MSGADILYILVIIVGGLMIQTTITVVFSYARLVRTTSRPGPRFLPWHVGAIGAAFIVLAIYGMVDMAIRIGTDQVSWRAPVLLLAFTLANLAQTLMSNIVRAQRSSVTATSRTT